MFRVQVEIFTPRSYGNLPRFPDDGYMAEDVSESIVQQIIGEKLIKRIQISDYISAAALEKLDCIFTSRPDISFRVYGGAGNTFGSVNGFNGWNLDFLRHLSKCTKTCYREF